MSKKKKAHVFVFCIMLFILIGFTSIFVNADDTESKICTTETRTYNFVLEVLSYQYDIANGKEYYTTFWDELPEGAELLSVEVVPRKMYESDFEKYYDLISNPENCDGTGPTGAPICEKNGLYSNSGSEEGWGGFDANLDTHAFWENNVVKPDSINSIIISCGKGEYEKQVECSIIRTWKQDAVNADKYIVPAIAEIKIKYEAEDCGDAQEEPTPEVCETNDSKNIPDSLNCSNGTYNEVKVDNVSTTRTITAADGAEHAFYTKYPNKGSNPVCTSELTEEISGTVTIEQNGSAMFRLDPTSIYAGGGFNFDVNYSSKAIYDICGGLTYKITEWYPTYSCPSIDSNNDGTTSGFPYDEVREIRYNKEITRIYEPPGNPNGTTCNYGEETRYKYVFRKTDYNNENYKEKYNKLCTDYNPINTTNKNIKCSSYEDKCWCDEPKIEYGYVTRSAEQSGCTTETRTYNCSTGYGSNCTNYSNEMKAFAEEMTKKLQTPNVGSTASVISRDSNDASNPSKVVVDGIWNEQIIIPILWYPKDYVTYTTSFEIGQACIGIYQDDNGIKAPITYITSGSCDLATTIDGGKLIYVPMKWPDGTQFPISVDIDELSIITDMNWPLDYNCGVDCYQKFYNNNGGFKFIYRPINMNKPFPNRSEGSNWTSFMDSYRSGDNYTKNKLTRNQLEYDVDLTPSKISQIKNYNIYSYGNMKSITPNGKSNALSEFNITNKQSNNYNKLGECITTTDGDKKCWTVEQNLFGW